MKVLKEIIDVDLYNRDLTEIIIYPNKNDLIFIDTNILIWMFRLNNESFIEFSRLLSDLSNKGNLIIPNWVIHEYNNLLNSNSEIIFSPFKKRLKAIESDIIYLEEVGRLLADNDFSKKHGFINKKKFVEEIKHETNSIIKKIRLLSDKNNFKNETRREFIEDLIKKNSSQIKIEELLNEVDKFDFRFTHKIPPGFEDILKPNNKYGDILIWKDIVLNCIKKMPNASLFLSLDVKKDWVYNPKKIKVNREIKNNTQEPRFNYILPWLEQEFFDATGKRILFSNIKQLADVLYSPDYNSMEFERFKSIAKTINIELNQNETHKVIEWLIVNDDKLNLLSNTICKWDRSPGEVDIDELKNWGITNIPLKIDFAKINWNDVFVQLFI